MGAFLAEVRRLSRRESALFGCLYFQDLAAFAAVIPITLALDEGVPPCAEAVTLAGTDIFVGLHRTPA